MSGRFTGRIKTRVQNEYITLPILVVRELSPPLGDQTRPLHRLPHRRQLYRVGFRRLHPRRSPTGTKVGVESATYDFGYGLRRFNWGRPVRRRVAGIPPPVGLCRPDLCRRTPSSKKISTASASTCITCISRSVSATGSDFHDTDKNRSFANKAPVFI